MYPGSRYLRHIDPRRILGPKNAPGILGPKDLMPRTLGPPDLRYLGSEVLAPLRPRLIFCFLPKEKAILCSDIGLIELVKPVQWIVYHIISHSTESVDS